MRPLHVLTLMTAASLAACATSGEPEAPPVVIVAPPVQTCAPVSALERIVIPAETKVQFAITQIENPPYAPIESKVKQTRIVKPAQILYVDSEGREVFDICEDVAVGETGPGVGDIIPEG